MTKFQFKLTSLSFIPLNSNSLNLINFNQTLHPFHTFTTTHSNLSSFKTSYQTQFKFHHNLHPTFTSTLLSRKSPSTLHHYHTTHSNHSQNFHQILNRTNHRREDNGKIKCTEINNEGIIVASKSMSKSEICAQNGLQPRDLRRIDSRISNVVPSILVRKEALIFNVLNIRAIIKANSVLILDQPSSPSVLIHNSNFSIRSHFIHKLLKNLNQSNQSIKHSRINDLPYEFRALETMLSSIMVNLEEELSVLKSLVSSLLDGLERNIEREKLKQLLLYSRRLSSFNSRALLVQECLNEILENDQDMADSYLSEKVLKNSPRDSNDHEELEQLIESFSKYVEEIVHEGNSILTNIKSTEEIIELILDSNRNTLLALDLKVSITTMGLGTGALLTGLFGMNLETGLEHHPIAFIGISSLALMIVCFSIGLGWIKLYQLRRIGLSQIPISNRQPIRFFNHQHHQLHQQGGGLDWDLMSDPRPHRGVK